MPDCPYCAERISAQVEICPHCQSDLYEPRVARRDSADDPAMRMMLPVGRSLWAIAAGYLGLFSFVFFPAPIALIVSIIAIIHLRNNPKLYGMGRAVFGLVMGIVGTIVLGFILVAMMALK